jgi:5-methyltetrahydrofolate--homocysteine methyltransferase
VLGARDAGIAITENYAMLPAASVAGFYLAHPDSRYFAVGKIAQDQLDDYAARSGIDIETARRRLGPNL